MTLNTKYCKVLPISDEEKYVALVAFNHAGLSVQLTDAVGAWTGQGCKPGSRGFPQQDDPQEWLSRARDALCALEPSTSYTYKIIRSSDTLQLSWSWKQAGLAGSNTAWVKLTPHEPAAPAVQTLLLELASSYSTVRAAVGHMDDQLSSMQQQLTSKDAALRSEIEKRLDQERGLYLKFAELLNQKKAKLVELQQQVTELQAATQQLQQQAQEGQQDDTDDEQLQDELLKAYEAETEDDETAAEQQQQQQPASEVQPSVPQLPAARAPSRQQLPMGPEAAPGVPVASPGSLHAAVANIDAGQGLPVVACAVTEPALQVRQQEQQLHVAEPVAGPLYSLLDAPTQVIPEEVLPPELLRMRGQQRQAAAGSATAAAEQEAAAALQGDSIPSHVGGVLQEVTAMDAGLMQPAGSGRHVEPGSRQRQLQQQPEAAAASQQQQQQQQQQHDDDPLGLAGLVPASASGATAAAAAAAAQPKVRKRARR